MISPTIASTQTLRQMTQPFRRVVQQTRPQSRFVDGYRYWQGTPWKDVPAEEFNSYRWQLGNTVHNNKLQRFLFDALPENIGLSTNGVLQKIRTKSEFITDAIEATKLAPMAIRLTPHVLSRIDWNNPLDDPIRRQFLPLSSAIVPDSGHLTLDSLHEENDSPVPGLVHRYPGRALFLATSICPVYCRFCTRSYAVGASTDTVTKRPQKPSRRRWETVFQWIQNHSDLQDIVVSGGDAYYLQPEDLREIGERLLSMDHVRRIRFASKGLAVAPCRIQKGDPWTETLIDLSQQGRREGKQVCLHTHINHPREITWVTRRAANYLFEHGVIVRNQAVLLNGVNNKFETLFELIKTLADINIQPYYIYQCDMVQGVEDLRTPLSEIIELDKKMRGTLSGFMMPSFVIDLPGGGGKRLVSTYESYDKASGIAKYRAPGLNGEKGKRVYTYNDPRPVAAADLAMLHAQKTHALQNGQTLEETVKARKFILNNSPVTFTTANIPQKVPYENVHSSLGTQGDLPWLHKTDIDHRSQPRL